MPMRWHFHKVYKEFDAVERVIQVREVTTRAGSHFRFLIEGKPNCKNSYINEDEFMKIDADECQVAKVATCLETSFL